MERFALKTNMHLACGDGPFLRQRVAEALAVSDTRRPAAGIWELSTSPNERKTKLWLDATLLRHRILVARNPCRNRRRRQGRATEVR